MLRWLFGNWFKQHVQRQIYQAALDAAGQQMRGAADGDQSASADAAPAGPDRCDVGLVFAMPGELHGLADRLSASVRSQGAGLNFLTGRLADRRVAIVQTGIGREAALRGAEALIDGHHPTWVISAGFAGALQPHVARNDFLLATEIVDLAGHRLSVDLHVPPEETHARRDLHVGRLLTVDRVIVEPAEKRDLGEQSGALAVDMETLAVADVCRRLRVRFLSVRVVSDGIDDRLPPEIERLARPQSPLHRAGLALGSLARRPSTAKDYWRLWRDGLETSDRLARFLEGMLAQLPRRIGHLEDTA